MTRETEREKFERWLGIKHCGAAHDLALAAWQARAALEAKQVEVKMPEPAAWLYSFIHSSATGKPDMRVESLSTDRKRAFNEQHFDQVALYTEQQVRELLATQARNLSATITGSRQPLTTDQIRHMSQQHDAEDLCGWSYRMGVQDAEKAHGIKIAD